MRIDRINEDGRAVPVRPASFLHDLTLDDPSIVLERPLQGCGAWTPIRMTPVLRLRLAATRLARNTTARGRVGQPLWYALQAEDHRVKALAALWEMEVCIDPDELVLALQDPTGRIGTALTQTWKAGVIETGNQGPVDEAEMEALLAPAGLTCIGLERSTGYPPEVDLYLAET